MTRHSDGFLPVTRRDAIKGVGLASLGFGAAPTPAAAGTSSRDGWLVKHTNYGIDQIPARRSNVVQERRFRSEHTLEYLGAYWDRYTSPDPETSGSWRHSFRLGAFGATTWVVGTSSNGEFVERTYEPADLITKTGLRVGTDARNLSVAPRRDRNLYGFFDPDVLEQVLEPASVGASGQANLSPNAEFTRAVGINPGDATGADYLENANRLANQREEHGEVLAGVFEGVVGEALTGFIEHAPRLLTAFKVVEGIYSLYKLHDALTMNVAKFHQGFDYDFPIPGTAPATGHYVYFDVYVPRGQSATFTVESRFTPSVHFADPAEETDVPPTDAWFDPAPQWQIQVDGPHNRNKTHEAATPIGPDADGSKTTVPLYRIDPDEEPLDADVEVSPTTIEPGDVVRVDATGSTTPIKSDLTYDVAAYRLYGVGDRPAPTPGHDTTGPVRGQSVPISVERVRDGVFDATLHVDDSSLYRFYEFEVVVTDERGMSDDASSVHVTVEPTLPRVALDVPDVVVQGDTVTLDATDTEGAVDTEDYDWSVRLAEVGPYDQVGSPVPYPDDDPEDGPISIETPVSWDLVGEAPTHAFDYPLAEKRLVYEIELTVTSAVNPAQTDTITHYLTVAPAANAGPNAAISLSGELTGASDLTLDGRDSTDPNGDLDIVAHDWTVTRQTDDWRETFTGETASLRLPCDTVDHAYTVELVVTDDDGATGTATTNFTVPGMADPGPDVSLSHSPTDPIVHDDTVTYTASVSGAEGTPTYQWTYSDPDDDTLHTVEGGETFSRLYDATGEAFVSVAVTDHCGTNSDDVFVTIRPNPEPTVSIDGPTSVTEGDTVTYTATASDDQPIADYTWAVLHPDGSDPNAGGGEQFSYAVTDPADFTVSVTVTDQDGATASDSAAISVNDLPDVSLSGPTTVADYSTHTYEASVPNDTVAEYQWSGPNGTTTTTSNTHTVEFGASDATVSVTAVDEQGASASDSIAVDVNDAPTVTLSGPTDVSEGDTATYTASVSDSDDSSHTYRWTYGQGELNTETRGNELTYTFSGTTDFSVQVVAEDDSGAQDSDHLAVTVTESNSAPSVSLSGPSSATEGDSVSFTADASDPDGDSLSYEWVYGQDPLETQSGGTSISDYLADDTDFYVQVTVEDEHGATASADRWVTVYDANESPSVSISYSPSDPVTYETVSISANASDPDGDSLSYSWSGASISGSSGSESWSSQGYKDVSVTVRDGHGNSASDSVSIYVEDSGLRQSREPAGGLFDTLRNAAGPLALAASTVFGVRGDSVGDEEVDR